MNPSQIAGKSEHSHQAAVFAWKNAAVRYGFAFARRDECYELATRDKLRGAFGDPYLIPELEWLHAIHNQGHGDAIRGARAKAEGVVKGVSDMFLPLVTEQYAGLYIELKVGNNRVVAGDEQDKFIQYANAQGYRAIECNGWQNVAMAIEEYLWPRIQGRLRPLSGTWHSNISIQPSQAAVAYVAQPWPAYRPQSDNGW